MLLNSRMCPGHNQIPIGIIGIWDDLSDFYGYRTTSLAMLLRGWPTELPSLWQAAANGIIYREKLEDIQHRDAGFQQLLRKTSQALATQSTRLPAAKETMKPLGVGSRHECYEGVSNEIAASRMNRWKRISFIIFLSATSRLKRLRPYLPFWTWEDRQADDCWCHASWSFLWNEGIHTSGGTKFMLLGSFTKHPSRSTADQISKSISCGRCGTANYHPLLNI